MNTFEIKYELTKDVYAIILLEDEGLDPIDKSDQVRILCHIMLPADNSSDKDFARLLPILCFGHRVQLFGVSLIPCAFEQAGHKGEVYRKYTFRTFGNSYYDAVNDALELAKRNLKKLRDALQDRGTAFLSASTFKGFVSGLDTEDRIEGGP